MKNRTRNSILTLVFALPASSAFAEIIPTSEDIKFKCEKAVFTYFEKEYENFDSKGRCGFENAFILNVLYKGETVSVLEARFDVCGGSGTDETVINNKTCAVVSTRTVQTD